MNRREFIKNISMTGIGLAVAPSLLNTSAQKVSAQGNGSKLVIATHPDSVQGVRINSEVVKTMVDAGIIHFTGQRSVADAWASVLTGFTPNDLVTIKVNCINRSLSSHPEVVDAIVAGLLDAGVKGGNIIIWDRTNHELTSAGYRYNKSDTEVQCFGTNEVGWGYDKQAKVADRNVRLSKILTNSDHLINVPVLKDHGTAGITLSMKNHYGSVDNPGILHGGQCDPYIGELCNAADIKDKTRIIVLDANLGIFSGGPGGQPQFIYNSVIFGQDPVALDTQGWKILDAERQKRGWSLAKPRHISTAAKLGLGTDDPNSIHIEMLNVKEQAVVASGNLRATWGALKK